MKFLHHYGERIAINEVPGVAMKFSLNICNQPWRPIDPERGSPTEGDPQKRIKADEMVHVGMGDKNVARTQQPRGTQGVIMPEVEQERSFRPPYFDKQSWIAKDVIDEMAGEGWIHSFGFNQEYGGP